MYVKCIARGKGNIYPISLLCETVTDSTKIETSSNCLNCNNQVDV